MSGALLSVLLHYITLHYITLQKGRDTNHNVADQNYIMLNSRGPKETRQQTARTEQKTTECGHRRWPLIFTGTENLGDPAIRTSYTVKIYGTQFCAELSSAEFRKRGPKGTRKRRTKRDAICRWPIPISKPNFAGLFRPMTLSIGPTKISIGSLGVSIARDHT